MADLISRRALDTIVSHMPGVQAELKREAKEVFEKAKARLASAKATTTHRKISGPSHLTKVLMEHGEVDHYIILEGSDPMAIEFGHGPSGFFAPEKYGKVTKAPTGLFILTGAAGSMPNVVVSSGRKIGKR